MSAIPEVRDGLIPEFKVSQKNLSPVENRLFWEIARDGVVTLYAGGYIWLVYAFPTSCADKAIEGVIGSAAYVEARLALCGRAIDFQNFYYATIAHAPTTADFTVRKVVNGVITELGYEAVDLDSYSFHLVKLSCLGSSIKGYRNGVLRVDVTDTTFTSGYFGVAMQGEAYGRALPYVANARLVAAGSPKLNAVAYFEVPVIGDGSSEDPFRAQMPEEIAWEWSLNPRLKKKYDVLKGKGFTDEEIAEILPEVLACRVNRLSLSHSALIPTDSGGKPVEYRAIVRVHAQPDRAGHLHPISRGVGALAEMKGVRRLGREEAVKGALKLDDKLNAEAIGW